MYSSTILPWACSSELHYVGTYTPVYMASCSRRLPGIWEPGISESCLRSWLFWDVVQNWFVVWYWYSGTVCQFCLEGSGIFVDGMNTLSQNGGNKLGNTMQHLRIKILCPTAFAFRVWNRYAYTYLFSLLVVLWWLETVYFSFTKLTGAQLLNKFSTSCGTRGSLLFSQENMIHAYFESNESSPYAPSLFYTSILSSHICLDLRNGLFPSFFWTKIVYAHFVSPIFIICTTISSFLLWSSYLQMKTNYEAMHTSFSSSLSLPPCWVQIWSLVWSQTFWI